LKLPNAVPIKINWQTIFTCAPDKITAHSGCASGIVANGAVIASTHLALIHLAAAIIALRMLGLFMDRALDT
jgi:hypothetical protein